MTSPLVVRRHVALATTVAALVAPLSLRAATALWDGGGANNNFNTPANWAGDTLPGVGDILTFDGLTHLTPVNDFPVGRAFGGITFAGTADAFLVGGNDITLNGPITQSSPATETITTPLIIGAPQNIEVTSGALVVTLGANGSGIISGAGGITKTGIGSLAFNSSNTYTGDTVLDGGTLSYGATNSVSNLIFGASAVLPYSSSPVALDLSNASLTAASLNVRVNSASSNTITIGANQSLTVNGPITVGPPTVGLVTSGVTTRLDVTGAGSLQVNTTSSLTVTLSRGNADAGTDPSGTLDLSGLSNFTFDAGTSTAEIRVGGGNARGNMLLANTSNTITAAALQVANSGIVVTGAGNNNGGVSTLTLGAGTNVIRTNTINLGAGKSSGTIGFAGSSGSLVLGGQAGGSSTVNITIGNASSATGVNTVSQISLAGHTATIRANTLVIGQLAGGTGGTGAGAMTFDTGDLNVVNLRLAVNSSGTATNGAIGTFTFGTDSTSTGTLTVTGQFALSNRTNTANLTVPANGTFTMNGGTATIGTDIVDASTSGAAGSHQTTLNLNGGVLDLTGHNIGSAAAPITSVNLFGGTLMNVNSINGTGGVTMTGFGTLILDGTNNYTGGTTITNGTVQVGRGANSGTLGTGTIANQGILVFNRTGALTVADAITGAGAIQQMGGGVTTLAGANSYAGATDVLAGTLAVTGSIPGPINVGSLGTLAGAGDGNLTGKLGAVSLGAGARLRPGTTGSIGDIGTLTMDSLTVTGGDLGLDLGATGDLVKVLGTASFSGASTLTPNSSAPAGTYTVLTAGTLNLTTQPTVVAPVSTRKTFTADYSAPKTIKLVVTGASKTLNWTGGTNSAWDLGATGTLNWNDGTINERFFNSDTVTFGDGPANRNIALSGTLLPAVVTVNNGAANGYTFSGTGSIGGGTSLIKSGAGALTLSSANSYAGGTTLNAGTLNINNPAAIGTGLFTIAGGTIDNTSGAAVALSTSNPQHWDADVTFTGSNDLNLGEGTVTIAAPRIVRVNGKKLIVGGAIGGAAALTKSGPGILTLAGANTFNGGMTLEAGTLELNHAAAAGTGPFTITGGTLDNTSGSPITLLSNLQNWNGDFAFTGTNPLNLGAGAVTPSGDRTLTINASSLTVGGVIGGSFALSKAGVGTLVLNGVNTYTGPTNVTAGTILVNNAATGNSSLGSLVSGAVNISSGGAIDLAGNSVANALNFGAKIFNIAGTGVGSTGALTNSGGVAQQNALQQVVLTTDATVGGTGRIDIRSAPTTSLNASLDLAGHTLTKNGTNQFTVVGTNVTDGNIVVNQGIFSIETVSSVADLGTGRTITFNAGTTAQFFNLSGPVTRPMVFNGAVTMGNASTQSSTLGSNITLKGDATVTNLNNSTGALILAGNISETGGPRGLTKTGASTLTLVGNNTYTGPTTISAGRMEVGNFGLSGTLGTGPIVNNGTLALNRLDDLAIAGAISGTGALEKNGVGTATLSGADSYTGLTTINDGALLLSGSLPGTIGVNLAAGTLRLGSANRISDSASLQVTNGTLDTGGFAETVGAFTLSGTARLELGTGASVVHFADSSAANWFGALSITNWSGSFSGGGLDQVFFGNSSAALTSQQLTQVKFIDVFGPGSGEFAATLLPTGELVAVPEPAAAASMLAGVTLLAFRRRRR